LGIVRAYCIMIYSPLCVAVVGMCKCYHCCACLI